jgi:hypothetical protein
MLFIAYNKILKENGIPGAEMTEYFSRTKLICAEEE